MRNMCQVRSTDWPSSEKQVREKSRECHNHKPLHQEEEETDKSKQAQIKKRTKSTKISSLFPKQCNRNAKRTEKHKNKLTQGKT